MARKKHRPEEAVARLRQVDVLVSRGQCVAEAIRAIGVTEVAYYRWRREFGGLKELEAENARLRKAIADLTLDKQILAEAAREATDPCAPARLCRAHRAHVRCLQALHLCGAWPAPLDPAQGAAGQGRRSATGEAFLAYVGRFLVLVPSRDDVVILDSLPAHKVAGLREAIRATGASTLHLPPYSPDLNPIEQALAKSKALHRKAVARTRAELWATIGDLLDTFTPAECRNYLANSGYALCKLD